MSFIAYVIYPILVCIPVWAIVCLYQINRRVDDIQTKLQALLVVVKVQKDFTIAALNQHLKNAEEKK